nr:LysR family transcriptional regulator [Lactiplantibacillus plantarum]
MNIKDLQYYVSLTQLKNFSLVAAQFHVSQPTISAAIRRLETELKTQLLIRANPHLPVALHHDRDSSPTTRQSDPIRAPTDVPRSCPHHNRSTCYRDAANP